MAWPWQRTVGHTEEALLTEVILAIGQAGGRSAGKTPASIRPDALLGGASPRDRVFCHFPHGNAARDSVMDGFYAGTSVRNGDWKLIRFYGRNDDGTDELELYNLKEDLGERRNLAKEQPALAQELKGLIDGFLKDTDAVIPTSNPNFGKAAPKAPAKNKAPAPDELPEGWKNRAGKAVVREGALHIESKGAGSFIGVGAGLNAGLAKLSFRIRAPQAGEGRIALLGGAGGAETFSVAYQASGEAVWQTITVELNAKEAAGILRFYLPSGSAAVELDDIVLSPAQGTPRRWQF